MMTRSPEDALDSTPVEIELAKTKRKSKIRTSYAMPTWWLPLAVFCACIFTSIRSTDGCYSVFYLPLMRQYNNDYTEVSQLLGLFYIGYACSGLFVPVLSKYWNMGNWIMVFGFISFASAFTASFFDQSFWAVAVLYSLIPGFCLGVQSTMTVAVVASSLTKHWFLAFQIMFMGYGLGPFIACPTWQLLISQYGWNGAIFIISAIYLNTSVCGAVLRPLCSVKASQSKETVVEIVFEDEETPQSCSRSPLMRSIFEHFDLILFKQLDAYLVIFYYCFFAAALYISASYLAPYGVEVLGLTETEASFLRPAQSIGEMCSKLVVGVVFPKIPTSRQKYFMGAQCAILAGALFVLPQIRGYAPMICACAALGLLCGCFDGLVVNIINEVFMSKYFVSGSCYVNIFGFLFLPLINLISGLVVDGTGRLQNVFYIGGFLYLLASATCFALHKRRQHLNFVRRKANNQG